MRGLELIKRITVNDGLFSEEVYSLDFMPTYKDYQEIFDAVAEDFQERADPIRHERRKKELLDLLQAAGIQPPDTK